MQIAYFLLLGLSFLYIRREVLLLHHCCRIVLYELWSSLPDPLQTVSIDGDCWICHLSKLDVTCALLDRQNVEGNVLFFFFFFLNNVIAT